MIYGFTALFEPIARDFGWSYTQISFAASIRGMEMGLMAPLTGWLADRVGPRKLVFAGGVLMSAGLFLLSRMNSLGVFYLAFLLISLGMSTCTWTVLMTAVANWFLEKIGLATGIAMCGFGFAGLMVPLLVTLIDRLSWRVALLGVAVAAFVVISGLAFVFRHRPEQYGYLPDGKPPSAEPGALMLERRGYTTGQALRTVVFWQVSLAFIYHALSLNAIVIHLMPYLTSIGITRSAAGLVALAVPLTSVAGRLGFGWLGDRVDRSRVAALSFVLVGLGVAMFGLAATAGAWLLVPFFVLFGIGYGGTNAMRPALVREIFGRRNFGAIFGVSEGLIMIGNFAGPPIVGRYFDTLQTYQGIWFILALAALVPVIALMTVKRPAETGEPGLAAK
ncbi:MAG: MFS transporter [Chloroflexi bacterium]|nr:MFS transporter [Chloroflexota bacterium]